MCVKCLSFYHILRDVLVVNACEEKNQMHAAEPIHHCWEIILLKGTELVLPLDAEVWAITSEHRKYTTIIQTRNLSLTFMNHSPMLLDYAVLNEKKVYLVLNDVKLARCSADI